MILVDTSVWIELLNNPVNIPEANEHVQDFATCGPILQEVLQGFALVPSFERFKAGLLAYPRLSDPVSAEVYLEAAEIFRTGRRKGYTIRSSVDCLIAAIAIENNAVLWHRDRDFDAIASYTRLRASSRYTS